MGEGNKQNCTRGGRKKMGRRIWVVVLGVLRERRKDRGKTKGFIGCGKLQSSALLKLPSHFFCCN